MAIKRIKLNPDDDEGIPSVTYVGVEIMASWGEWCWDGIRFCDPVDGSTVILNASYSNTSNTTLCWDRLVDALSTWRQGLVIQVSLQILQILFSSNALDGLNIFLLVQWMKTKCIYNQEFGWMFCSLQVLAGQSRFGYLRGVCIN